MCRAEVPTYPGDEISELPRVVGKLTSARGGFATTRRARGAADPLARMILARARCAWHAYLSPPRITLAPATRTRPPPTLRRRHHHHHHPRAMSTADDAPRGDSPNPGDAASYDEQLAVVRALKASGAPPDQLRAASARLNTLKRANKLPRYTPSRKSARRHPPGGHGSRDPPGPPVPGGLDDAPRASKRPGKGPTMTCPSCLQTVKASHPDQFRQHVAKCCPDAVAAVPPDAWHDVASAAAAVAGHEAALSDAARTFAFRGERRMSDAEVAEVLGGGVTPARVRGMLRRASRAIPLVADVEPLDVVHEDNELLVVNKPPGLRFHPVHRFEGNSLLSRVIGHVRRDAGREDAGSGGAAGSSGGAPRVVPRVVHRLDMDTSGVCVFVKDPALADGFARQFRGDAEGARARKEYLAVTVGRVPEPDATVTYDAGTETGIGCPGTETSGTRASGPTPTDPTSLAGRAFRVDAHVGAHATIPEARWVHPPPPPDPKARPGGHPDQDSSVPKPAVTECAVVSARADPRNPGLTAALVHARPLTGRTHQIRVHLAHASLPIVSDPLYGPHVRWGGAAPAERREDAAAAATGAGAEEWGGARWLGRQALHAARLTVTHPRTGEVLTFDAAMPEDMRKACEALGLDPQASW